MERKLIFEGRYYSLLNVGRGKEYDIKGKLKFLGTYLKVIRWKGFGRILLYKKKGKNKVLIDDISCNRVGCEYGEFDSWN